MKKLIICFVLLLSLSACAMLPVEETMPPPVLTTVQEVPTWNTVVASRHDLSLYTILTVEYVLPRIGTTLTSLDNFDGIEDIFVSVGDFVNEGEILARFHRDGLDEQLTIARRNELRASLDLSQNQASHLQALERADTLGTIVDDSLYVNQRRELQHRFDLARFELLYLLELDENLNIRAPLTGIVSEIVLNEDQPNAAFGRRINWGPFFGISVSDHTLSVFRIRHPATQHIQFGDILEVRTSQAGQVFYMNIVAIDIDELNVDLDIPRPATAATGGFMPTPAPRAEAFFIPVEGEHVVIAEGTRGTVVLTLEEALDVVAVPITSAINVDGQYIVFVIENGIRVRRDVEVGMTDRTLIEIRSGLEVGEVVVR